MTILLVKAARSDDSHPEKERCIAQLKRLLADCFQLRRKGAGGNRLIYAQGYADGYMQLLLDAEVVAQTELLAIVAEARRGVDGPATATSSELSSEISAASA